MRGKLRKMIENEIAPRGLERRAPAKAFRDSAGDDTRGPSGMDVHGTVPHHYRFVRLSLATPHHFPQRSRMRFQMRSTVPSEDRAKAVQYTQTFEYLP